MCPLGSSPQFEERHPRDVLREHSIRANKALGQNFIVSGRDLDRIAEAADIAPSDVVLEVGTGMGNLTARLAERARVVVSVEIDESLYALASARLRGATNILLLRCDFLSGKHLINPYVTEAVSNVLGTGEALKCVSNLPFGISSPAILNMLEWEIPVTQMCLTLQHEVAERLTAKPGTKQYGPLTVFVDYWATVKLMFTLPPKAFWPVPEVASSLVRITRRPERKHTEQYEAFATVVNKLFMNRRKTLERSLKMIWGSNVAETVIQELKLDARQRVEQLRTKDLEAIAVLVSHVEKL